MTRALDSLSPARPVRAHRGVFLGAAFAAALAAGVAAAAEPQPQPSALGSYLAGRYAQHQRDLAAALDNLRVVLEKDPNNPELVRVAMVLSINQGRIDDGFGFARQLIASDKRNAFAPLALAVAALKAGKFDDAEARVAEAPESGFNTFLAPLLKAWLLAGRGRYDDALAALEPLSSNRGFDATRFLHLGLLNDLAGRRDAAEEAYGKSAEAGGGLSLRLVELQSDLYQRTRRPDRIQPLYEQYLEQQPGSQLVGPVALKAGAERLPKYPIRTAAEGAAEALFSAANSFRQQPATEAGVFFARLALYLRPEFPHVRILIADILESNNRFEDANKEYAAVDGRSAFAWASRLRMASNLSRLGRQDQGVAALQAMAKDQPDQFDPHVAIGDIERGRDRFEDAVRAYDEAFKRIDRIERRHWSLYYTRGIVLERSKQWSRAEADFLKALELELDQPYVLNYLGYSWIDQGVNLERGRKMIERAVELRPNDGYIVDSLGWALYRMSDFAGAVRELERAVEIRPEDPVINDHLGDAYWRVGRRQEAYFQWRRSLTLKPEPELKAAVELKLRDGLGDAAPKPDKDG